MSRIEILSDELVNQIAAGEVIERPASVVKELVENSLDAEATKIDIQVEGSGARLIRVIDNGRGMDEDDVLLSLERHGTSKLTRQEQLASINTLGFRGEAIPTIASVSKVSITSRIRESSLGTQADIRYGELHKVHESGAAYGTVVEARNLFGNVPARRKFLKTARTETNHIEEVVINTALSRVELALNYELNGHRIHSFQGHENLGDRLRRVMAIAGDMDLIRVATPGRHGDIHLAGYLLPPEHSRAGRGRLRIFVNRRPVQDRMISHAVSEGMQGFLMKGRRPNGVLFVNLPPDQVDVNVHPAKHEVRFPKPHIIHQLIVKGVCSALADYQNIVKNAVFSTGAMTGADSEREGASRYEEEKRWTERASLQARETMPRPAVEPEPSFTVNDERESGCREPGSGTAGRAERPEPRENAQSAGGQPQPVPAAQRGETVRLDAPFTIVGGYAGGKDVAAGHSPEPHREESGYPKGEERPYNRLTYIGQFRDSYLLCEGRQGLVVIDQHAAHERLLYENLKKQYGEATLPSQSLLFPEIIDCDHEQEGVLDGYREEIAGLGFVIEPFGGKSYAVKAVPAILSHLGPQEAVAGLFSSYLEQAGAGDRGPSRLEDILAGMACKAAVKARHHLQEEEGKELLKRMQKADVFSHCPHGRPVLRQFSDEEIKKWFYRT